MFGLPLTTRRRGPTQRLLLALATLGAIAMVGAACGELTPPEAYSPSTSSTVVTGSEQEAEDTSESALVGPVTVNEFVPSAQPGYVPSLLVAADELLFAVDARGSTPLQGPLASVQATRAVDDLVGGLVVQYDDGSIVYHPALGQSEVLDDSGSTLLDVGYWDGSPRAFVQAAPDRIDWIQLVSERPGAGHERRIHIELEPGESVVSFSASGDIQAVVVQDELCGELRFFNSDGDRLSLPEPEPPECTFPRRPSYGSVALSPLGATLATTVVTYRDDGTELGTDLVVRNLFDDGAPLTTRVVGEDLDAISSLSYDGERVAFIRSGNGEPDVAPTVTILDLTVGSSELVVDLLGQSDIHAVAFARVEVAAAA